MNTHAQNTLKPSSPPKPPRLQGMPCQKVHQRPTRVLGDCVHPHDEHLALPQILPARGELRPPTKHHDLLDRHALDEELCCSTTAQTVRGEPQRLQPEEDAQALHPKRCPGVTARKEVLGLRRDVLSVSTKPFKESAILDDDNLLFASLRLSEVQSDRVSSGIYVRPGELQSLTDPQNSAKARHKQHRNHGLIQDDEAESVGMENSSREGRRLYRRVKLAPPIQNLPRALQANGTNFLQGGTKGPARTRHGCLLELFQNKFREPLVSLLVRPIPPSLRQPIAETQ